MGRLSENLLKLREELGFRSAQAFYRHAADLGGVRVNYAHYKKIESGLMLPKPEFVSRLGKAFPEHAARLVHAFCQDQFPDHAELFGEARVTDPAPPVTMNPKALLYAEDELTPKQVAVIVRSEWHYGLYMLLNLARRPVTETEIRDTLSELPAAAIADLIEAKLAYRDDRGVKASAVEARFPESTTDALRKAYRQMDQWDLALHERFGLQKLYRWTMYRRVSPRYLPLIRKFAEVLTDQVRTADESEISRNDDVVYFSLDIRNGKIPG